jgi:transcriptional regulator CtsR
MTSDKLSSLTRTATPALSVLFVAAAILFAGPFQTATATGLTTTTQEQKIIETQDSATDQLSESDRDVNGIEFTPRWGAPSTIQPNTVTVLFAECLKDEFAVSSMFISETSDIAASQSFPVALPDNSMVWLSVVKNTDTNEARAASVGVICADENNGRGEGNVNLDINTKTIIQNTIKNIINVQNNQITNLVNVVNVYQQITNNAIQILSATGNNNTVNQVISQSAAEIANQNATAPAQINQIIKQNAEQQGVITGGGGNLLNQTIDQNANQAANMTGGLGNTVDQGIDQGASQGANMTGGLGNTVDQFLGQNANQTANVAGEE